MKNISLIVLMLLSLSCIYQSITHDYINKYKDIAIEEMNIYKIPASITLSQGILESSNGESFIAKNANNHFGIKCHSSWKGEKIYYDDDIDDECFRKYDDYKDSYRDHSLFLANSERYSSLFKLPIIHSNSLEGFFDAFLKRRNILSLFVLFKSIIFIIKLIYEFMN